MELAASGQLHFFAPAAKFFGFNHEQQKSFNHKKLKNLLNHKKLKLDLYLCFFILLFKFPRKNHEKNPNPSRAF